MRDLSEESGGCPDADSRHAGQNRLKRVCLYQTFDFAGTSARATANCSASWWRGDQ